MSIVLICSRCGEPKNPEDFFHRQSGKLYSWCKKCHRIRVGPKPPKEPVTHKECSRCGVDKVAEDFRPHRAYCRKCEYNDHQADPRRLEYQSRWRGKNREYERQRAVQYNHEHAEERAEKARKNRLEHPELNRRATKEYRIRNPEVVSVVNSNRRARIIGTGNRYSKMEWNDLKDKYNHTCLMCGRTEPDIKLTPDHVVPLSKGGSNSIDNIQPLCRSCNSRKHVQTLDLRLTYNSTSMLG